MSTGVHERSEAWRAAIATSNTRHGHYVGGKKSPTYSTWYNMKSRCMNQNAANYARYGGRGVTVCERWYSFENFLADMGERPTGTSLDRIDNNGNYEPGNCRWATAIQQMRNRKDNHVLTWAGRTLTVQEWGEVLGVRPGRIIERLRLGWTVERALTQPAMLNKWAMR